MENKMLRMTLKLTACEKTCFQGSVANRRIWLLLIIICCLIWSLMNMTSNWWKIIVVLTRDAKGVLKGVLRCLLEKNRTSDSTRPSLEDKWVLEGVYMKGGGPALLVGLASVGVLDFTSRLHGKSQPSYTGWLAYSRVTRAITTFILPRNPRNPIFKQTELVKW